MNLCTLLETMATARPDQRALIFEGRSFTYGATWDGAGAIARRLRAVGVQPGDRVGLLLPNVPAFPMAFFGALRIGAIAVPISPGLTADELGVMLDEAGVTVIVTLRAVADGLAPEVVDRLRRRVIVPELGPAPVGEMPPTRAVEPDDPAAIIFSSGTTGRPKGVTLSHHNIASNVRVNAAEVGMTPRDRVLLFMPLFHCYGLDVILNSAFSVGATVVLERRFDPRGTPATINREQVTMFFGVPTTFIVLLQGGGLEALASLRYCYCAAAPLPLEIEARWRAELGLIVNQAYGLSEAAPCVSYNAVGAYRPGSIGLPSAGVEVRVVDPDTGRELPPGAVGEFRVRSAGVMLGYWGRPEATARVLQDGWLRTGDLGWRDADGYLFITDRLKDMINCAGLKVFPAEVENALYRHPSVGEAAVVGVPDGTMGEVVHAQVAPKAGHTLDVAELRALIAERLAAYKRPTRIRVVEALPKGRTGKILRRAVRADEQRRTEAERAEAERAEGQRAPRWTRRTLQQWIVEWLRGALEVEGGIAADRAFIDAGVDSLLAVRQAEALSALLGRTVPVTATWLHPTPARLAAFLIDGEAARPSAREMNSAPVSHVRPPAVETLTDAQAEAELQHALAALGV